MSFFGILISLLRIMIYYDACICFSNLTATRKESMEIMELMDKIPPDIALDRVINTRYTGWTPRIATVEQAVHDHFLR